MASPQAYTPKHLSEKILTSRHALEGERKQVTVLFADLERSMELSEQLDPEEWHGILDRFFQILADGIHRYEGTINQYTGDGIMALFGAPIAHEDHALRACYAALHLRDALRHHADELRVERGINFGVRMGLNSGEVVVGKIGDDLRMDYTAQGHTVGLAARMEQLSESGRVYLTEYTAHLVEGFFELRDLGPSRVKGATKPVHIFDLEDSRENRTRLDVSLARGFSRFVGRKDEMAILESALHRAVNGNGSVVGIVGDPGVGKSRLCYEFLECCRNKGMAVYEAHCTAYGKKVPLLPLIHLVRGFFGISGQEGSEDARKKIAGTLILLDESFKGTLPIWFDFLAVADPRMPAGRADTEKRQQQLFALVLRLVQAGSEKEPTVILVDDLHWIDPASDAFISLLVAAVTGSQIMLLLNFRPEYSKDWMRQSIYQNLPLPTLSDEVSHELLSDLLGHDSSVRELAEQLSVRTLGNPFFIEELVKSLVESGELVGQRGKYRRVKLADTPSLPRNVHALLAARIDRLGSTAKQVLQTAAVIGEELVETVLRNSVETSGSDLDAALNELQRAEFIYQKDFYPQPAYIFKHHLVREVAYHSLLTKTRTRLHRQVAETIEQVFVDQLDEQAGLLAHHWELSDNKLKASRWHHRAASLAGFADVHGAFFHWCQVLKLLEQSEPTNETRTMRLQACCGALGIGGRVDISPQQVAAMFDEGRQLAEELGDSRALLRLNEDMAARLGWSGDLDGQRRYLQEATHIAQHVADLEVKVGLLQRVFVAVFHQGDLKEALSLAEEGIAQCETPGPSLARADANRLLRTFLLAKANTLAQMGELKRAAAITEQAAHIRPSAEKKTADTRTSHTGALIRAQLSYYFGNSETSLRDAHAFIDLAERSGSAWAGPVSGLALGRAHILGANWLAARETLQRALTQARQFKLGLEAEALLLAYLAQALTGCGEVKLALDTAEEAITVARSKGTRFWELHAQLSLAGVLLYAEGCDAGQRIEVALDRAEVLLDRTAGAVMRPRLLTLRARLAQACGDLDTCRKFLHDAHQLYNHMGADGFAERIADELGDIET
jgi:predicted ATPase/class 3 adenylate cyclase